jgi:flagellin
VLEEAGHPPGFPLFEASMDIDDAAGNPAQAFTIHFGKFASSIGSLRQTTNNVTIAETDKAITALDFIDKAADVVNDRRARMGATMSRIEYTINNLMNVVQNTEEAKSRILDTDYAAESAALAKAQVLAQAGTAMLAQANQSQQYVLNLLKGM